MESGKNGSVTLWVGIGAAVAGIIAVAALAKWRGRNLADQKIADHLRDVQDVLKDCYDKIHEIELHLPEIGAARPLSNGKAVFDS